MDDKRCAALITGASSGIGAAFARELAETTGLDLFLVARRAERLEAVKKQTEEIWRRRGVIPPPQARVMACDLTSAQQRRALLRAVEAEPAAVTLLINNAGFGAVKEFNRIEPEKLLAMIELNCAAPVELCRWFVAQNSVSGRRGIINVCSTAAYQPMPYMAVYSASKAFLLNFSLGLRREALEREVCVLALCPGPTESEFHAAAGLETKIDLLASASAESVVRQALAALEQKAAICINGRLNRGLALLTRIIPQRWAAAAVGRALAHYAK